MTALLKFKTLGGVAWNMVQWIELRIWARTNGIVDTVELCNRHIADCRERARRINALPTLP